MTSVLRAATGRAPRETTITAGDVRPAEIGWKPVSTDERIASARIRCLQPLRTLRARGVAVELFDPQCADAYRVVVYSKRYDERSRREAETLRARGVKVVLDLCDNHFYVPNGSPTLARAAAELRAMVRAVDEVVASTDALAEVVRQEVPAGAPVTVIGDAVEAGLQGPPGHPLRRLRDRLRLARLRRALAASGLPRERRLVWFGVAGGPRGDYGMRDLLARRADVEAVARTHALSLTVVSNSREMFRRHIHPWNMPTFYLDWSAYTFDAALREHAVAVIPVTQTPFTRCKTNNRVATALSTGLAVVADSIPSYRPFAAAARLDDWEGGLRDYLSDPTRRAADVEAGRALLARDWSDDAIADRWLAFFRRLIPG